MKEKIAVITLAFVSALIIFFTITLLMIDPIKLKRITFSQQVNEAIPTDLDYYILANEEIINNCQLSIENVNPNVVAIYPASITYQNKVYEFQISVEDKKIPIISLKDKGPVLKCFIGELFEAKLLVDVQDDSDYSVFFEDKDGKEFESLEMKTKGSYDYFIRARDQFNNLSTKVRVRIEVDEDIIAPVFTGLNAVTLKVGSDFNPMDGVTALDNADGDVTAFIEVDGNVDTYTIGTYELVYSVKDKVGNRATEKRTISVTENGIAGQKDVMDGPFLTFEMIGQRDRKVGDLLESELDYFNQETFLNILNQYLINHFTPSKDESSYSVIINGKGSRQAMARAVKVFLDAKGIDNVIVKGKIDGMMWNLVKTSEGYRHLDVYANCVGKDSKTVYLVKGSNLDTMYRYDSSSYPNSD